MGRIYRGAKCHCNSLRKSRKNHVWQSRPFLPDCIEAGHNVLDIVGNRRLTILPRHPTGNYPIRASLVKPVKRLN